jgi:hypothetical protein
MRVRLGSQRALITPLPQIRAFDLVRIQALVLCFETTYDINNIIRYFGTHNENPHNNLQKLLKFL